MRRYITVTVFTMIMLAVLGMIFLMRNKFPEGDSFYITVNSQDGSSEMILPFDTEDDCAVFGKDHVRVAWKTPVVLPVAQSHAEQILAHKDLRLGVLAMYLRHVVMALLRCKMIHPLSPA